MKPARIIAIDGPAASGKSTVAKRVAAELDAIYVDSGSLYRGMTWAVLHDNVDPDDEGGVLITLAARVWTFDIRDGAMVYQIDEVEPGDAIRDPRVDAAVSAVARIPAVRQFVTKRLRGLSEFGNLVVEGRDIGSVVFPDTPHKYFITADPAERAKRARMRAGDESVDEDEVKETQEQLEKRDEADSKRKTAPLQIPLGAIQIDTTDLAIEEVVDQILEQVRG